MKIQVNKLSSKKYLHPLSHDVSTTSGFGFCQPCLVHPLIAQDTVTLRTGQVVRLNPMPRPTFGDIKLKTYTSFVKTADIYHAYESFLSGQQYNGVSSSYIPDKLPVLAPAELTWLVYGFSTIVIYKVTDVSFTGEDYDFKNPVLMNQTSAYSPAFTAFIVKLQNSYPFSKVIRDAIDAAAVQRRLHNTIKLTFTERTEGLSSYDIDSADWIYCFTDNNSNSYVVCGNLTNFGRNLRKILLGSGYQLSLISTKEVEIVRLFAYYKAYFDIFFPQRTITWKNTSAFKCMEMHEQLGISFHSLALHATYGASFSDAFANFVLDLVTAYYTINPDFASAHIIGTSTDTATAAQSSVPVLDADGTPSSVSVSQNELPVPSQDPSASGQSALDILRSFTKLVNIHTAVGGRIRDYLRSVFNSDYVDEVDSQLLGSQQISFDMNPVFSTNQSSVVDLAQYGGEGHGSTNGSKESIKFTAKAPGYLIQFFAIVPDAKLSQAFDPSVFAISRFDQYHYEFDGKTLVPTEKASIFGAREVHFANHINTDNDLTNGFGNIPLYTGFKIKHNILNGDMSLASTRRSYLPFTVDKIFPWRRFIKTVSGSDTFYFLGNSVLASSLVAGEYWRYIGRNEWFGNFNRIFLNDSSPQFSFSDGLETTDDNFIIQMFLDFNVHSYMLPMSQSFQTGASDGDTISVQKA